LEPAGGRTSPQTTWSPSTLRSTGPGQYCGRRIEITAEGKTAIAEIVDECPGCGAGGLDRSHGLFEHFAPDTKGVLSGSWRFVS
jgi:hypothetical protein